jgi:hypothetical protein
MTTPASPDSGSVADRELVERLLPDTAYAPLQNPLRAMYRSLAKVVRLTSVLQDDGVMAMDWNPISDVIDPFVGRPGLMLCRLDLQFVRPGKDAPMPLVAGRAPDRVGLCFFDLAADDSGHPLVQAADRLVMVAGPVTGTFDIRVVPDVAQDWVGAHHVEVQVIEVSQALKPGSYTPYPGGRA